MKNTTTLLLVAIAFLIAAISCSPGPSTTVTPTVAYSPASVFASLYPTITSCTLRHYASGHYTGAIAYVDGTGNMVVTGYGSILGGSYKIVLTDSATGDVVNGFDLVRSGPDTLISKGNGIRHTTYAGGECYRIQIEGGGLPMNDIVRGVFIDSL